MSKINLLFLFILFCGFCLNAEPAINGCVYMSDTLLEKMLDSKDIIQINGMRYLKIYGFYYEIHTEEEFLGQATEFNYREQPTY